jgi:hypothetical protein
VGPALYITHTELQARAARAFAAAGHRDSALYYYRAVAHAWEGADPVLKPRRDSALAAIRQLEVSPTR